jgi:hypothetical protein
MIQSKQVGAPPSSSIVNYRLTCGFFASVFERLVPKEDSATLQRSARDAGGGLGVTPMTYSQQACREKTAPRLIREIVFFANPICPSWSHQAKDAFT